MFAAQYIKAVQRTVSPHNTPMTNLLGLRGETGEVADVVKKAIGHAQGWGANHNRDKMIKELGDSCWYATAALTKFFGDGSNMPVIVMEARYAVCEDLETLADQLCEAASKIGHATFQLEMIEAGQEFFALVYTMGQALNPPISVEEIWDLNVAKLMKRYPNGFSTEASLAKADEEPALVFIPATPITPEMKERLIKGSGSMPVVWETDNSIQSEVEDYSQSEVDNYATAGNGYDAHTRPTAPNAPKVGTFEEARATAVVHSRRFPSED